MSRQRHTADGNTPTEWVCRQNCRHRSRWKWKLLSKVETFGVHVGLLIFSIFQILDASLAIKNENLPITELCQRTHQSFLSNIPRLIDGAVVVSHNERDMDCIVTFQTDSILEKFMIRFEDLKIDCNDQLHIFDGAHAIGNPKIKISCDKTITNIGSSGTVYTQTNFLTLRYVTDSWGTDLNGFKMIITAFKDSQNKGCRDGYKCEDADICIHNDLVCDNVKHCKDGDDERSSKFCTLKRNGSLFSAIMSSGTICPCDKPKPKNDNVQALGVHALSMLDTPTVVAIVFGAIFFILAGLTAYMLYTCRRREQLSQEQQTLRQQTYQTAVSGNVTSPAVRREYKSCTKLRHFFLLT